MKTISLHDAVAMIPDGARLMIGGFMGVGTPQRLVDELLRQGKRGLTVIGVTVEQVLAATEAALTVPETVRTMSLP